VCEGIPDFRSPGGLWSKYDPRTYCDYRHFLQQPQLFWEMAKEMHEEMRNAVPNAAHMALARMEREGFLSSIITQNVDNLHQVRRHSLVFHSAVVRTT
jgi:NAD-dependent deacetylase